tara:strand:+ start:328 stop:501 length:174 start_codon:yes stop_codon:yes gene_type:complete
MQAHLCAAGCRPVHHEGFAKLLVLKFTVHRLNVNAVQDDEIKDAWLIISNTDKIIRL